ncbi:MAG: hypothetical protein GY756_22630 [bacterium]|nr:hypothetical protein [bacterium]
MRNKIKWMIPQLHTVDNCSVQNMCRSGSNANNDTPPTSCNDGYTTAPGNCDDGSHTDLAGCNDGSFNNDNNCTGGNYPIFGDKCWAGNEAEDKCCFGTNPATTWKTCRPGGSAIGCLNTGSSP